MKNSPLDRAYRQTSYYADLPDSRLRLRIGEPNAQLERFLQEQGCTTWAYLTAYNPRGVPVSAERNRALQEDLIALLEKNGHRYFLGEGKGDDGDWPAEPSLLVLGISPDEALGLGRQFEQIAILVGARGGKPELVYTGITPSTQGGRQE